MNDATTEPVATPLIFVPGNRRSPTGKDYICLPYADGSGWLVCDFTATRDKDVLVSVLPNGTYHSWNGGRFAWTNPAWPLDSPFAPSVGQPVAAWKAFCRFAAERRKGRTIQIHRPANPKPALAGALP